MDERDLFIIKSGDLVQCAKLLKVFVEKNEKTFDLSPLVHSGQWTQIWACAFNILCDSSLKDAFHDCLVTVRILSRDKTNLDKMTSKQMKCLLNIAGIGQNNHGSLPSMVSLEAVKCMCNLVFQSNKCMMMCSDNGAVDGIVSRVADQLVEFNLKFFDMKLLFLLTTLNELMRPKLRDELKGISVLIDAINSILHEDSDAEHILKDCQMDLIIEILKILFNITFRSDVNAVEEIDDSLARRMSFVLRKILMRNSKNTDKINQFQAHVVNLLTNVPSEFFDEMITACSKVDEENSNSSENENQSIVFEGHDVSAVQKMIDILKLRLTNIGNQPLSQQELISPILVVLIKCVRCSPVHRHYIRTVILPPLKNVEQRPEIGDELRNHLCRLLTSAATQVRDLTAELLFVICKENVWRLTKYTGYGNAAGMFANRGLLGGNGAPNADYSSDSEDSDTEEYKQMQHTINPVLGCTEPPRSNPFEGMSEEQKEYEAMKLVNLMEKLSQQGVVQPCRIGEDGRPVPVEHILQLQEGLPDQQLDHKRKT